MRYRILLLFVILCNYYQISAQNDSYVLEGKPFQDTLLIIKNDTLQIEQLLSSYQPTPPKWSKVNRLGFDLSEIAFLNWNAGGNNAITTLLRAEFNRKYKDRNIQWTNEMLFRFGLNLQEGQKLRKSDDVIQMNSTFGARHDALSDWYMSAKFNFQTQFASGYKYPDREQPISKFMAPGYLLLGVGAEYSPDNKDMSLYISPLTQKTTFVLDQSLADSGAFGVRPAAFDTLGVKIRDGQKVLTEIGILITHQIQRKIYENMFLASRIALYTDYLNSFGNIDINWILDLELRVNEYVKATLGTHIIYDNDVKFSETDAVTGENVPVGPRLQLKQLLGIGLIYNF
ncbi:DUF3078 domain-containing protein [Robertkochia marina]|uniref:DUF3078 domain-containing protein n=1 Tax=Robertkochia marina TaxID=1227945 RepID=A0A4S3M5F3_9FLAO|nr:DUF3078 domain-containing protein [Robertkochia marina]TRZ47292.1 DUF3078 domain-containing protein [Robertkochia marina]